MSIYPSIKLRHYVIIRLRKHFFQPHYCNEFTFFWNELCRSASLRSFSRSHLFVSYWLRWRSPSLFGFWWLILIFFDCGMSRSQQFCRGVSINDLKFADWADISLMHFQAKSQQDKRMWVLHLKRLILENHPAKIPAKVRARTHTHTLSWRCSVRCVRWSGTGGQIWIFTLNYVMIK